MRPSVMAGNVYGRLTVLKFTRSDRHRHPWWLCRCACGELWQVRGTDLITGKTRSCGCLRSELSRDRMEKLQRSRLIAAGER